jgi:hypothetical protein
VLSRKDNLLSYIYNEVLAYHNAYKGILGIQDIPFHSSYQ